MRSLASLLLLALLCGCGGEGHNHGEHAEPHTVSLYQNNRGLLLPADVRASIGVTFIEVPTGSPIVVATSAVVHGVQGDFVYVESGEHIVRTPVSTGAIREGRIEITDGLLAGDRVASAAHDLWMIELLAIRGGSPCCPAPKKDKGRNG